MEELTSLLPSAIIRVKSDNCSSQYKCGRVFHSWCTLAKELQKKILVYYGVSGHGKGFVDAMSAFDVKNPWKRLIIWDDFEFDSSFGIFDRLRAENSDKQSWLYHHIDVDELRQKRQVMESLPLKGSSKFHMMCFHPDGTIVAKENICSCKQCIEGDLLNYVSKTGRLAQSSELIYSDREDEDEEDELEMNEDNEVAQDKEEEFEDWEEGEDRFSVSADAKFECVETGTMIAIYSHPKAIELFCIIRVTDTGIASEEMEDEFKHVIRKSEKFITGLYLEYDGEKQSLGVVYKEVVKTVYILPIQLFSIAVPARRQENQKYVLSLSGY